MKTKDFMTFSSFAFLEGAGKKYKEKHFRINAAAFVRRILVWFDLSTARYELYIY